MLLILDSKETRNTKTGEQYMELWFSYPDGSKKVRYWLWSFVHNDINCLSHIWEAAKEAKVGNLYNLQFRKAAVQGYAPTAYPPHRTLFVVTVLDEANKPITFL